MFSQHSIGRKSSWDSNVDQAGCLQWACLFIPTIKTMSDGGQAEHFPCAWLMLMLSSDSNHVCLNACLEFMVNNHPPPTKEPKDKGGLLLNWLLLLLVHIQGSLHCKQGS